MNELLEVLKTGGAVMVTTKLIILAGSVAAVIIGVERALFLRGFAAKARELHEQVLRALLRGDAAIALHECDRSHVATAALYPYLEVIAPVRLCGLTREDSIVYAGRVAIRITVTKGASQQTRTQTITLLPGVTKGPPPPSAPIRTSARRRSAKRSSAWTCSCCCWKSTRTWNTSSPSSRRRRRRWPT